MGKFLEVAIRVKNRKGEKGKAEAEDAKKKRGKDGDKKTFKCPKKCPKIFAFGADEVVVANEVSADNQEQNYSANKTDSGWKLKWL